MLKTKSSLDTEHLNHQGVDFSGLVKVYNEFCFLKIEVFMKKKRKTYQKSYS